jgi:hypothetical protein
MRPLAHALIVLALAACSPPRSASYFAAHAPEAERVVADCRAAAHRGEECINAQAGLAAVRREERMDRYRKSF